MGLLRGVCCLTSFLVALLAVLLGLLLSGALAKTGVFRYLDGLEVRGDPFFKGIAPATHEGTPWGFTAEQMPDLQGQVAVVTGANIGLGYWTVHHLAKAGATVVLGCRSMDKCEAAASEIAKETGSSSLHPMPLDLSSFKSVRAFAKAFSERFEALDALVLNAGIMSPPFSLTEDGLESQIGTNHFGHFLLVQELMPRLEAAAQARGVATVTAVSSAAHYDSYPEGVRLSIAELNDESTYVRAKAYGQSKLANVLFVQELAERVKDKGILVNAAHPGAVHTNLGQHLVPFIKSYIGDAAGAKVHELISSASWHPRDAALTQLYAAVGPALKEARVTGKYFHPIARETRPDAHAFNQTLQKGLWEMTQAFVDSH